MAHMELQGLTARFWDATGRCCIIFRWVPGHSLADRGPCLVSFAVRRHFFSVPKWCLLDFWGMICLPLVSVPIYSPRRNYVRASGQAKVRKGMPPISARLLYGAWSRQLRSGDHLGSGRSQPCTAIWKKREWILLIQSFGRFGRSGQSASCKSREGLIEAWKDRG